MTPTRRHKLASLVVLAALAAPDTGVRADGSRSPRAGKHASSRGDGGSASTGAPKPAPSAETSRRDGSDAKPRTSKTAAKTTSPKTASSSAATSKSATSKGDAKKKKEEPKPLPGRTIDFDYDAKETGTKSRAYTGRVFVHERAAGADRPLPLVVFIHGLNKARIRFRWMGGGDEGDVRRIVADLIDGEKIPPVLVAGPSSIEPDAVAEGSSFPVFDFDRFLELTEASLDGVAKVDETKIIVAGHSGAGCSSNGGIVAAARAKHAPHSVLSIDTCMGVDLAKALGAAPPKTNVIVTWQTASWDRNFDVFTAAFRETAAKNPAEEGVLRELDKLPALARSHDATVGQTFSKYLPRLLE
jgi:hypothetical protein